MIDSTDLSAVRAHFDANKAAVIERYGAVGAGIGRAREGASGDRYVIVVYLKSAADLPPGSVELDGISLRFEVTGAIEKQPLR